VVSALILGDGTQGRSDLVACAHVKVQPYSRRGIPIDPSVQTPSVRHPWTRITRLAVLILLLSFGTIPLSEAGAFTFPVQSEQVITGTTTGLAGAQTDDGVREGLHESDTASDSITTPSTQTLTTGTIAGGAFPAGISSEDATFVQYREALPPSTDYDPTTQTITTGAACGGTFPTSLQASNDAYLCIREASTASAISAATGAFNIGTGVVGTTVPVTGVGFQPTVVLFWWSGRVTSTDSAGTAHHQRGFGVAISTTDRRAICSGGEDAVAPGSYDSGAAHRADEAICSLTVAGGIDGLADLSSMDSDGFTMIIDDAFATNLRIHFLALGGSTLTNAATGMFTESGATGNQDITTVGFQPDAVILFSAMIGADPPGVAVDSTMMVGFAAGTGNPNDVVWAGGAQDSPATVQTQSYQLAGESIALFDAAVTLTDGRGEVDAWLSNGFSLNWNERAGSRRIHYLALKGGSYVVGDLLTLTTTGTIPESGFGFSPKASLFLSHNKAQSTVDTVQAHDELSVGAFSSTTARGAQCVIDEDGVDPSDVGTAVEHDEVYCNLSTLMAIEGLMGIQSVDSGGFTLVMDDADPSASHVGYWSIGDPSVNYQISARHDWSSIATGADAYDLCVEAFVASGAGESALVQVLTPPATWNTRITVSKTSDDNADQCYTLTTTEFNAGAPSLRWIGGTETGDATQSDVNIDHERIIRRFTNYRLDLTYEWTGVPAGDSYALSVKGYRSDEDVNVQVLTPPATWNTRLTVNSIVNTLFTYTLTPSEYNVGSPQVRFLDGAAPDPSASDLFLDWVAITTIRLTYSLEVRQNATGIITGSNPILVVKGNVTAGGENFHVQVWSFTAASWGTLLTAPFTPTNAYHNASLAADHLSGGTVRVRFVDAASQDATRWALSLDFVAVVIMNDQATLTNAGVSPASGYITTSFTFFVRYSDPENNAPAFVNLTLDGISYAMVENISADTNYVDGKDYFLNRVIGIRGTFNYSFSARASAGDLTLATTPVRQLSVLNRAPSISNPITSDAVHTGRSYVRDFNGTDPDGDTLVWSISTNASWLTIGSANGTVWGVAPPDIRSFYANLSVSDGLGGIDFRNFSLAVVNRPPAIFVSAPSTAEAGASYSGSFSGTDPDDDPLSWSLTTNATWLLIDAATGQLYGTPSLGTYFANLSVRDPYGGVAFQNFTITVQGQSTTPPPDSPLGLPSELWTFLLIVLLFVLLIAIVRPRRRPIIESAFLIDQTGRVRFEFAIPGTPYDEGRLQSTLRGVSWKGLGQVSDPPYTLHIKPDPNGDWIFVSRTSDTDRVMKSAEKLISKVQGDVTSRKKPRLSEGSS